MLYSAEKPVSRSNHEVARSVFTFIAIVVLLPLFDIRIQAHHRNLSQLFQISDLALKIYSN